MKNLSVILKYITPFRIGTILILIQALIKHNLIQQAVTKGFEPGLGGLTPYILIFLATMTIILDVVLSIVLDVKKNWFIQGIVFIVVIFVLFDNCVNSYSLRKILP